MEYEGATLLRFFLIGGLCYAAFFLGRSILRSIQRLGSSDPRIGTEAIDYVALNRERRMSAVRGNMFAMGEPQSGRDDIDATFPRHIDPPEQKYPEGYDEKGSATNLVQGIVRVNTIVVFMRRIDEFDGTSIDTKMREMLDATGIPYKAVDVSRDPTMHLAFPEDGSEIALPVLYAHGQKIGTFTEVDQLFRSGSLKGALEKPL